MAGVANIADDLIIYRNCVEEHDRRVYPAQKKIADIQDTRACQDVSEIRSFMVLALVVQKMDKAIHWINLYPLDSAIGFPNTYPLDSDLSGG